MHIKDLVTDWSTGRLDYKKLALNTCALMQAYTWLRMAHNLEVHRALENPNMWIVAYMVIAGHDLLGRFLKIRSEATNASATDKPA